MMIGESDSPPEPLEIESENAVLMQQAGSSSSNPLSKKSRESRKRSCGDICYNLFIFFLFVSLLSGLVYLKVDTDQNIQDLKKELSSVRAEYQASQESNSQLIASLQRSFTKLKSDEESFQETTTKHVHVVEQVVEQQNATATVQIGNLWSTISLHDYQLKRLSNGTSNADVLDKLVETKQHIDSQLTSTQFSIANQLTQTKQNVSQQLDSTVVQMKQVVSSASMHIREVENNVTTKLNGMSQKLTATVSDVNIAVTTAQDTIHDEVDSVKNKIEQYVIITNKQFAAENDFVKYQLAGFFTLLGCLIFLWHLTSHSRHYHKPDVQRRIMAVLWMVPVYGITSWLSMVYPRAEPYFATARDCFESYVVYTFVAMLIAILSDGMSLNQLIYKLATHVEKEKEAVELYRTRFQQEATGAGVVDVETATAPAEAALGPSHKPKEHLKPPFPCCYRSNECVSVAAAWLYQCQLMAMQFVIFKPLLTVIPLIIEVTGAYDMNVSPWGNNTINWHSPKLYIIFFQNVSVAFAFYGLLSFYHGVEKDLEWCDPWPKFLCVKSVVFATFWQNIAIQAMTMFNLIDERAANQIQNLLICIEMLVASLAHIYIFPYQEWAPGYQKAKERNILLRDTMAFGDFLKDMKLMVTTWDTSKSKGEGGEADEGDLDGSEHHDHATERRPSLSLFRTPNKSTGGYDSLATHDLDHDSSPVKHEGDKLLDSADHRVMSPFYHVNSPQVVGEINEAVKEEILRRIEILAADADPAFAVNLMDIGHHHDHPKTGKEGEKYYQHGEQKDGKETHSSPSTSSEKRKRSGSFHDHIHVSV